jgi:hypothetical protein
MTGKPLRESDMRSLERRRLYTIFHPLDSGEPLPREKLVEANRHRVQEVRLLEVAAALYLPGLMLAVLVMASLGLDVGIAFGVAGLMFIGFLAWVAWSRYR